MLGAVEEVRRQGDEALGGEPVGDVADVVDQAPPLLHDDDAGAVRRSLGFGEVALAGVAVAGKAHHLAHGRDLLGPRLEHARTGAP